MENSSKPKSPSISGELGSTSTILDSKFHLALYTLNIAKNIIGSFILFLPWTFDQNGVLLSNIQLVFVFFVCAYSFCLISYLGKKTQSKTYSDMFSVFNKIFVLFVDISIIGITLCGNAGYIIFIKMRINAIILQYTGYNFSQKAIAAIAAYGILFPLSLLKRLNSMRGVSFTAFIAISFFIIAVISLKASSGQGTPPVNLFPTKIYNFALAFPILAANFDCHTNALTFYQEYAANTSKRSFKRYIVTVFAAFFIVLMIISIFATVCYLTIGKGVSEDALSDYPESHLVTAMSVAIVYSLIITYALFFHSIRVSVHFTLFTTILSKNVRMTWWINMLETFVMVSITAIMGIFIDDIALFSACFWAIFGSLIVYIFPAILALKIQLPVSSKLKAINIFVLLFGIIVSLLGGLGTSIYEWVKSKQ